MSRIDANDKKQTILMLDKDNKIQVFTVLGIDSFPLFVLQEMLSDKKMNLAAK